MVLPFLRSAVAWLLSGLLLFAALPNLQAQHRFTRLHSFGPPMFPPGRLIEGSDGAFYGIGLGNTIVKLSKGGSDYTAIRSMPSGWGYVSVLLQGSDGILYGRTEEAVFKLNRDGTGFVGLHRFESADEGLSVGALVQGCEGVLYGTTLYGGGANDGTVFKLNKDGTGFTTLRSLTNSAGDGMHPITLVEGTDRALYGTAFRIGAGTVFKLNKDGSEFTVLHQFIDGYFAEFLLEGADGILYGYTGEQGDRLIFKLNKDGTGFTELYHIEDHDEYVCRLVDGPGEALYWSQETLGVETNRHGPGLIRRLNKDGSGNTILHEFPSEPTDGNGPLALILATDGALYGSTRHGGGSGCEGRGCGTLYKVNPDGTGYQVMRRFHVSVPDGSDRLNVIAGSDGMLYGTARQGGSADAGTVFKLNRDGTGFTVLHEFQGAPSDGARPVGLTEGSDGALYGATQEGGSTNYGTLFKLEEDGMGFAVLHSFLGEPEYGRYPKAPLLEGSDGALYGTTTGASTDPGGYAQGTLFKLNKDGTGYMALRQFGAGYTHSALLEGSDGALYGTTCGGDDNDAVFKLNKDGTGFTLLHEFVLGLGDEAGPEGALVEGSDGALYGTTAFGGSEYYGTVFKLNRDGTDYTVLHRFLGGPNDGAFPYAALVASGDGALYGTTQQGGREGFGTVFRLNPDGNHYAVLWGFTGSAGDTVSPRQLVEGLDGTLYGVGDGHSWRPYIGTSTLFRLEVAPVLFKPVWSGHVFSYQFSAGSNVVYQPQFTSSLADSNWTALPSITGQRGIVTVTDTNLNSTPRFYRVVIP